MLVFSWLLLAICCIYFVFILITKATDRITLWYLKMPMLMITASVIAYVICVLSSIKM